MNCITNFGIMFFFQISSIFLIGYFGASGAFSIIGDVPTPEEIEEGIVIYTKDLNICYYNASAHDDQSSDVKENCFWSIPEASSAVVHTEMVYSENLLIISFDEEIYQLELTDEASDKHKLVIYSAGTIQDIAVDYISGNIYYIDAVLNAIRVTDSIGSFAMNINQKEENSAFISITVDPVGRHIFWVLSNQTGNYIGRSNLDGSDAEDDYFGFGETKTPYSIIVDISEGMLYWTERTNGIVGVIALDGTGERKITEDPLYTPTTIAITMDDVIWTEYEYSWFVLSGLYWTSKETGNHSRYDTHVSLYSIVDVLWYSAYSQPEGSSRCSALNSNGGCSQLCFDVADAVLCKCSVGYELQADQKTCQPVPIDITTDTLILGDSGRGAIFAIDVDTEVVSVALDIPIQTDMGCTAVDIDTRLIFWANSVDDTVMKASLDGGDVSVLLTFPEGHLIISLHIDPIMKLIFINDYKTGDIFSVTYNGEITTIINQPYAWSVVPDIVNKVLYIVVAESIEYEASILRVSYDGSEKSTIISESNMQRPRGLAIDFTTDLMYWLDGQTISEAKTDGTARRSFNLNVANSLFVHVAYSNDFIYIVDWQNNHKLTKIDVTKFEEIEDVGEELTEFLHTTYITFPVSASQVGNRTASTNPSTSSTTTTSTTTTRTDGRTTSSSSATTTLTTGTTSSTTTVKPGSGNANPQTGDNSGSNETSILIGVVVGVVVLAIIVILVVVAAYFILRRRNNPQILVNEETDNAFENPGYASNVNTYSNPPTDPTYDNVVGKGSMDANSNIASPEQIDSSV